MRYKISDEAPKKFVEELRVHPVIAQVLWQRNIRSREEADVFLRPSFEAHSHSPFLFRNMRRAVERIFEALKNNENIVIHGDYDADGVTGSAVLFDTLMLVKELLKSEAALRVYIPDREKEGYGLRTESVERFQKEGIQLIVTVDCGIANVTEAKLAKEYGIDMIVVDHHAVPEVVSDVAIILHPHVAGETYPWKPLAAVGVSYKFCLGILAVARERGLAVTAGFEKWLLDYVAIATVTDIVPLLGENRVLEKFGLIVLQKSKRPGFAALFEAANIDRTKIDTTAIGYQIGPRINAAGRMRHASLAVDLLTTPDLDRARVLAKELNDANTERQRETTRMVDEALLEAKEFTNERVICIAKPNWPHGLVGLVASRLVQEYRLPAYVVGITERGIVGSGRGIPGFNVTEALHAFHERLERFGGHPQACGFTVKSASDIEPLFTGLRLAARERLGNSGGETALAVDVALPLRECSLSLAEELQMLEPHGDQNPRPVFVAEAVTVATAATMGKENQHIRIQGEDGGVRRVLVGWNMGKRIEEIPPGTKITVIYELLVNEWNGRRDPQLRIKDFIAQER